MTACPLAGVSVTVKTRLAVPALPSVTAASLFESDGSESSSLIAPIAEPSRRLALDGAVRATVNVSSASDSPSPATGTLTVWLVAPTPKVSVPLVVV